jgi:hypothetical protein
MEPIEGSETSAFKPQTPGKYPKENILHNEHGESLKSRHINPPLTQCIINEIVRRIFMKFDMGGFYTTLSGNRAFRENQ